MAFLLLGFMAMLSCKPLRGLIRMESRDAEIRHSILEYLVRHPGGRTLGMASSIGGSRSRCEDERLADQVLEALVTEGGF